jgi:hypothetical protein
MRDSVYKEEMAKCVRGIYNVLKPRGYCAFIVGDVRRNGKAIKIADLLGSLVLEITSGRMRLVEKVRDEIPDVRRARRGTQTTKEETLLIFRKSV